MSEQAIRRGVEQFTGAYHPVTWSQARADDGLPAWMSDLDGQCFMDSEVEELITDE